MNKKILSILSGVALVSVATVGFSSWVIGLQNTETQAGVSVSVDTVINDTQYLSATLSTKNIYVAENKEHLRVENDIIGTTNSSEEGLLGVNENALTFSFSEITVTLGDNASNEKNENVIGVKISLPISNEYNSFLIPGKDYLNRGVEVSQLNYLNFVEKTLSLENDFNTPTINTGYKTYELKDESSSFKLDWGSFFDGNNPVTYYNGLYNAESDNLSTLLTRSNNAYTELKEMNSSLTGQTLTFMLSLVYGN